MFEDYSHLPKKWSKAKASGSLFYFTGKPCPKGHNFPRYASNGCCVECSRIHATNKPVTDHTRALNKVRVRRYKATQRGRSIRRSLCSVRRAGRRNATPAWCNKDNIYQFICGCPTDHHIDHIIPLRGKTVCGLHVLENLQYLPAQENMAKSNKIDPLTLEANVCVLPGYRSYGG